MMRRENQAVQENQLEQPDLELQLKVWKELAISKQVLMQTATKALGLKDECSTEELEAALSKTLSATKVAEDKLAAVQAESAETIKTLEAKLEASEKANGGLIAERDQAIAAEKEADERVAAGRAANAEELKKVKAQLADKQKEIKQITKILADTPENVVKKMKALKKEKMDEANLRKKAEEVSRTLRKDKQKVEQQLADSKGIIGQTLELVESLKAIHKQANEQYNQLVDLVDDKSSLVAVPALNEELIESIEKAAADNEEKKK